VKRILLDQGLPRSTAALLSQDGWDVIHVSEIGMGRAGDTEILQRARTRARVSRSMRISIPCSQPAASAAHL